MRLRRLINLTKKALQHPGEVRRLMANKRLRRAYRGGAIDALAEGTIHPDSLFIITLDSCRFDVFDEADAPTLKSIGEHYEAHTPAVFTFAAHASLFVGMTPGIATSRERYKNPKAGRIFRIVNTAAGGVRSDWIQLEGRTIVEGFRKLGYYTVGVAASRWFNPEVATGTILTQDFEDFRHSGTDIEAQVAYLTERINANRDRPIFAFVNVGETHIPYHYKGAPWPKKNICMLFGEENDAELCRERQRLCLEFTDEKIAPLVRLFQNSGASLLCMGDHGDCHGEDGVWAHGVYHEKVMKVPMVFHLRDRDPNGGPVDVSNEGDEVPVLAEMGDAPEETNRVMAAPSIGVEE
ncbi:MAG: hypothetical protein ACF8PN_09125 [Phycisphaerales bacterium]